MSAKLPLQTYLEKLSSHDTKSHLLYFTSVMYLLSTNAYLCCCTHRCTLCSWDPVNLFMSTWQPHYPMVHVWCGGRTKLHLGAAPDRTGRYLGLLYDRFINRTTPRTCRAPSYLRQGSLNSLRFKQTAFLHLFKPSSHRMSTHHPQHPPLRRPS